MIRAYTRAIIFLVVLGLLAGFAFGLSVGADIWLSPLTGLLLCLGVLVLLATFIVQISERSKPTQSPRSPFKRQPH